jgi:hypothetical protein
MEKTSIAKTLNQTPADLIHAPNERCQGISGTFENHILKFKFINRP